MICRTCHKRGHFSKVCWSKNKTSKTTGATENLAHVISVSSNSGLENAIIPIRVNNLLAKCLLDIGSSSSFINLQLVRRCQVQILLSNETINMASLAFISQVEGSCTVSLEMLGNTYKDVKLLIIKDLCADITYSKIIKG